MSKLAQGWEIVCPDGKRRWLPYRNLGDAECDARVVSERGCCIPWKFQPGASKGQTSPEEELKRYEASKVDFHDRVIRHGACPEGAHTVEPTVFDGSPRQGGGLN